MVFLDAATVIVFVGKFILNQTDSIKSKRTVFKHDGLFNDESAHVARGVTGCVLSFDMFDIGFLHLYIAVHRGWQTS